jgi:serine/threonine protein kinase
MAQKLLQYEVIDRLGEGARSTIYAVYDPLNRHIYALKHVVRKEDKDQRFIDQVKAEFEVTKLFNHPNLRRTFELKFIKGLLGREKEAFLIMEMVDGKALDQHLPPSMLDILETFIKAAEGLKAMHQLGYVHCDIKPNNILRNDAGDVKVIDFGQSVRAGTTKERIQGTPDYIAPEQVARKPVTPQTDVFNLGATIYWALAGRTIPTLYTVGKAGENSFLLDTRIDTPQQLNPKVPTALSNLVMECIATSPSKRPASMEQVVQRLELAKHVLRKQLNQPSQSNPDVPQALPRAVTGGEEELV